MNRIIPNRVILFACLLALVAVVLHVWQVHREEGKAATAAAQRAAEAERQHQIEVATAAQKEAEAKRETALKVEQEAAAAHARFVSQYEETNFIRTPTVELIAVACAAENETLNQAVSAALVSRFRTKNAEFTSSFFKPTLVTEGPFNEVFNGSGDIFRKLDLTKYLDGLLLARQEVQYSTNADLNNVVTADMHLQIEMLPVSGLIESRSWTLAAKGAGFNPADARMQAEERVIKQITVDTNMSLVETGQRH